MKKLLASAAALVALPAVAFAQAVPYSNVSGWSIFSDRASGECFMEQQQGDLVIHLTTFGNGEVGYIWFYGQTEVGLEVGDTSEVFFDFPEQDFYGTASGRPGSRSGTVINGAYVPANNGNFLTALANEASMVVTGLNNSPDTISLRGTRRAIAAMQACDTGA